MKYREITEGWFIDRPNRFIAHVDIDGRVETVHVKNTGRCRELLRPGAAVCLEVSDNPRRKTKYDLISVFKENLGWVNIDSQAPNKVVREWLEKQDYEHAFCMGVSAGSASAFSEHLATKAEIEAVYQQVTGNR